MLIAGLLPEVLTNPVNWFAQQIGAGVTSALKALGQSMGSTSKVTFGSRFVNLYDLGFHLAIIIAVGAVLYGCIAAALSGDIKRLTNTLLRVVTAILASFALLTVVLILQGAIYQVDQSIASTFSASNQQVGASIEVGLAGVIAASVITSGGVVAIFLGLAALFGILILWGVLLMSAAIVYLACFFAPLAFVVSAKAGKKILELLVAMLLVPFVITSVIAVGVAIIADGGKYNTVGAAAQTIPHFIMGIGLLYVGIFSPLAILRFLPIAESHIAQLRHPHQAIHEAGSKVSNLKGGGSSSGSNPAAGAGGGAAGGAAAGVAAGVAAGKAAKGGIDKATRGTADAANSSTSGVTVTKDSDWHTTYQRGGTESTNTSPPPGDTPAKQSNQPRSAPSRSQSTPQPKPKPSGDTPA